MIIVLEKHGRRIEATYEVTRSTRIDLKAYALYRRYYRQYHIIVLRVGKKVFHIDQPRYRFRVKRVK